MLLLHQIYRNINKKFSMNMNIIQYVNICMNAMIFYGLLTHTLVPIRCFPNAHAGKLSRPDLMEMECFVMAWLTRWSDWRSTTMLKLFLMPV